MLSVIPYAVRVQLVGTIKAISVISIWLVPVLSETVGIGAVPPIATTPGKPIAAKTPVAVGGDISDNVT